MENKPHPKTCVREDTSLLIWLQLKKRLWIQLNQIDEEVIQHVRKMSKVCQSRLCFPSEPLQSGNATEIPHDTLVNVNAYNAGVIFNHEELVAFRNKFNNELRLPEQVEQTQQVLDTLLKMKYFLR